MEKKLYSISEAARALSLSHWTIRAWIRQKKIKTVAMGSRRLLAAQEIDRLARAGVRK
jgi:excisionase family DNA binding protein